MKLVIWIINNKIKDEWLMKLVIWAINDKSKIND